MKITIKEYLEYLKANALRWEDMTFREYKEMVQAEWQFTVLNKH